MLGPDHPDTLDSLSRLATVIGRQGEYERAEELHRRVLESERKCSGAVI